MQIGRIITDSYLKSEEFPFIEISSSTENIDSSVPTLIVGKTLAESIYGKSRIHILDRHIENNVSWTFSKFEKNTAFEEDVKQFKYRILKECKSKINYRYYSITLNSLSNTKNLISYLCSRRIRKTVFRLKNHLYIYDGTNRVLGVALGEVEYYGVKADKAMSKIKKNPYNKMIYGFHDFSNELKSFINGEVWLVPYLYY